MKRDFLGDANDHLKGALHRVLREADALRELFAVPLITDEWEDEHVAVYARLLGLAGPERVIPRSVFTGKSASRRSYFEAALNGIPDEADVLLDPDTGLRNSGAGRAHVLIEELGYFAAADAKRLIIVYDESRDRRVLKQQHVDGLGGILRSHIGPTMAYEAGRSLTMFIVSRDAGRVAQADEALRRFLGCAAHGRVRTLT